MNRHPGQPIDHVAARRLIDAYLVDQLAEGDAARLADHLRDCPACAAELGGSTRLIGLLASLQTPAPTPDLDERIILAAIANRRARHERRSWLIDLRTQILRGAMRTTGTLVATVVLVSLLSVTFVFAASFVVVQTVDLFSQSRATVSPTVTPTHVPTVVPSTTQPVATDTPGPTPTARPVTPKPTLQPTPAPTRTATPEPTPEATPSPSPSETPEATPSATVEPTASPTPTDTPSPTPTPTEKPKRTPTPAPSALSDSASPIATPTPLP